MKKISVFWFRRDLRLEDNLALTQSLKGGSPVLPLFLFDTNIIDELPADDARISFIYRQLEKLNQQLSVFGSSLSIRKGDPLTIWRAILCDYELDGLYFNRDYEPYALERDRKVTALLSDKGIAVHSYKDQVIFEGGDILKSDGKPYTLFTPYKRKWLKQSRNHKLSPFSLDNTTNFYRSKFPFPELKNLGFMPSAQRVKPFDLSRIDQYDRLRDYPAQDATSHLGPHLRFGTLGIRQLMSQLKPSGEVFLSELIWREFFAQILYHFPELTDRNFKRNYDGISWRNDEEEFRKWCEGITGYPLVDAGMRELSATGYMHNRVRMITASFLTKHLLIDWRWGEAFFAGKLLDYELSSNNGNWQWAAGTGCDAAPYFRIFNPLEQARKFDPDRAYIKKWIPEIDTPDYPSPLVEHKVGRDRAIKIYRNGRLFS
ncbi:MAG: deoxyribodipyrimidine photo-lyase [Bacteroidales bacterium]|nr:deoxyribodipyrimidine photo-lyase [Bacteroidales bacterium]